MIFADFPNVNKKVTWSPLHVGKNAIFMEKFQQYHSNPYILCKNLNIVRISLSANIFSWYYFGHTFLYFFETIKKLIFSFTTIHFQCHKLWILLHLSESFDVHVGCLFDKTSHAWKFMICDFLRQRWHRNLSDLSARASDV